MPHFNPHTPDKKKKACQIIANYWIMRINLSKTKLQSCNIAEEGRVENAVNSKK